MDGTLGKDAKLYFQVDRENMLAMIESATDLCGIVESMFSLSNGEKVDLRTPYQDGNKMYRGTCTIEFSETESYQWEFNSTTVICQPNVTLLVFEPLKVPENGYKRVIFHTDTSEWVHDKDGYVV